MLGRNEMFVSCDIYVGLSNKLDSELVGRKPVKRSHGQVVGTAIMDGKLLCKIVQ